MMGINLMFFKSGENIFEKKIKYSDISDILVVGEKNFGNEESLIIEDLWANEFNPDEAEAEIQSNPENDFDAKNETRDETLEKIFETRRLVMRRGCQFLEHIEKLMTEDTSYEDLLEFHSIIHNVSIRIQSIKQFLNKKSCQISTLHHSGVRMIGPPYNIMICLPPKCGTTNWQKGMNVLQSLTKDSWKF